MSSTLETPTEGRPPLEPAHNGEVLLEVENLVKHYPIRSGKLIRRQTGEVHAVCGVSFTLEAGTERWITRTCGSTATRLTGAN